eukprot:CAMPEP_0116121782 /NCGR_PEP_ID=MMETSP0329-20121206/3877_1 /TAXON_ID=697910 /ORGANISM="Pseudo-nitzschia arenysensis, Strain B593" /LENGTH=1910 /DNA_ID=CAMNT_0003615611 /DNA_START=83 /DNA_END=5815 /DNA_ORIENTATION=-
MKESEAVARTVAADARTKTTSNTATEKNIPTISTQKSTISASTTRPEITNPNTTQQKVMDDRKGRNAAPIVQKNSELSSTISSSKDDGKKAQKSQIKGQSKDSPETMKRTALSSTVSTVHAKTADAENVGGNDRVTVDKKPNQPLIPEVKKSSSNRKPGNAKVDSTNMPSAKPMATASTIKNAPTKPLSAATITRQQPPTLSQSSSTNPVLTKTSSATIPSSANASKKNQVTSAPNSDMDDSTNSIGDEELQRQRAPLTDKYNPYITHSDTSLADARRRLQIALDQTRQLRAAFTERVYGKYRVCLQPPPLTQDIIKASKDDPSGMHRKLELELKRITEEKNAEKREAQKINSSDAIASISPSSSTNVPAGSNTKAAPTGNSNNSNASTSAASNADSAEQNLYVTSGLSLIVLPEDSIADVDMTMYRERAPINPKTNQRVKGISAAAATSGKLMLDRARHGKVARADREKRLLQKVNQKAHNFFDRNYYTRPPHFKTIGTMAAAKQPLSGARNVPSTAHKTKPKLLSSRPRGSQKVGDGRKTAGVKRAVAPKAVTKIPAGQTAAGAKAIRARVQTPMTVQTLLNLNPIHEELRTDTKYSAATLAMMERGVGTFQGPTTQYHKNTPHRFKHPFPDSLGGRRRPVASAGGVADASNATNAQLTLPPVPSVKERRRHKKITVLPRTEAGTTRAALSIRKILDQFTPSPNKAAIAIESIETQENPLLGRPKKHRKISEIGFVRGLYLDSLEEMGSSTSNTGQGNEVLKKENSGIDSTLTLNVLKAVGLIKSSVSSDMKPEKFAFETSLASSLFKDTPATDSGPYSYSISKLSELEQKLSTQKRSFTAAFYSDTKKFGIETSVVVQDKEKDHDQNNQLEASAPIAIRGGGSGGTNEGKESVKTPDKKSETGGKVSKNSKISKSPKRKLNMAQNQTMSAAATQANLMRQNLIREERLQQQRLASLQAQGVAQQHSAQLQAQLQSADHYRQTNALQLAHQLRLSRLQAHGHSGAADLTDYIGGLHHSPQAQAAYGWSQASAAAAVANSNNLAALGLNPAGVMPLTVEDRTRVLLAREQQNLAACVAAAQRQQAVALMRGMAVVDTPFAQAGYPHIPGQLLNPTAAALIARQGMQNRAMNASSKKAALDHKTASQKTKPEVKNSQKSLGVERDALKAQSSQQNEKKVQQSSKAPSQNKINDKRADSRNSNVSVNKKRKNSTQNGKAAGQSEKRKRTSSVGKTDDRSNQSSSNLPKSSSKGSKSKTLRDKPSEGAKRRRSDSNQSQDKKPSTKKEDQPPTSSETDKTSETQKNTAGKVPAGLQYYVPEAPSGISSDFATLVLAGRCHEAIGVSVYRDLACEGLRVVNYITSVGMAVPIPKTVVMNPLKDRMNGLVFKNSNVGSMPASSRDIIAAVILLWLWRNQEGCFQRAFAKSGRIDVDPECKWFVSAAVNKAVTALSNEVIGSTSRANGLTTALLAHKSKSSSGQKGVHGKAEQDSLKTTTTKIDLLAASVVSKSLNMTLVLNEDMNSAIPQFNNLVDYLDECRKCALFAKAQERVLLAAVVSRKATMSLSFSHAYVSAMVRAGEALGHGPLFEVVQNEKHGVSTMIPYDVFTDESGAWEDPCRPTTGFTQGLTGDQLMRRAHTRAMIQKSLKKLQDRQNVKGGTPVLGPYVESNTSAITNSSNKANSGASRGGSQRRRSSFSEPSIQPGSGSAAATSWSLYNPNHQSPPLEWDASAMDNAPYGRFDRSTRPRSLSLAQGAAILRNSGRGQRRRRSASGAAKLADVQNVQSKRSVKAEDKKDADGDHRSTREIPWGDIAGIFQKVELPNAIKEQKEKESKMSVKERTIFAPIVSWPHVIPVANDDESDEEEDLSDETILGRHRVVLDRMKARLSSVMENRKRNQQDRRKSREKSSK